MDLDWLVRGWAALGSVEVEALLCPLVILLDAIGGKTHPGSERCKKSTVRVWRVERDAALIEMECSVLVGLGDVAGHQLGGEVFQHLLFTC